MTGMKKNVGEKEEKCPDDTAPVDTEVDFCDIKNKKNEKSRGKKINNAQMTPPLLIWRKV